MAHIPYGRQDINAADVQAVVEVMKSDWITQGPFIEKFEHKKSFCTVYMRGLLTHSVSILSHFYPQAPDKAV